jgi:cytidine deaminase
MKEQVYTPFEELDIEIQGLLRAAREALVFSYHPHGARHFSVGAAVLTNEGNLYRGANVEIAGLSGSVCAERSAFIHANSQGDGDRCIAIAIVTEEGDGAPTSEVSFSCGSCLQFIAEFARRSGIEGDFQVITATTEFNKVVATSLREVFPNPYVYRPRDSG